MTDRVLYFLKDIPNNISGWEEKFPNLTQQQSYIDTDFKILGSDAVDFFKSSLANLDKNIFTKKFKFVHIFSAFC